MSDVVADAQRRIFAEKNKRTGPFIEWPCTLYTSGAQSIAVDIGGLIYYVSPN